MSKTPLIIGIGGTTRRGSSTEKALAVCLKAAEREGAQTVLIAGPELQFPIYAPDQSERPPTVRRLIDLVRRCDGIIVSTPSYHGSISGLVKNALDYTEDLRDDARPYFDGRPVGLIAGAAGWQASGQTLAALRAIVHALRGWPTPLGAMLNTAEPLFDQEGCCLNSATQSQLETMARQVVHFARMNVVYAAHAAEGNGHDLQSDVALQN